jgi:putative ABC transport system permease protein
VLLAVLTMYVNFKRTIDADGRPDRVIVLSKAATAEYESRLSLDVIAAVADAPRVKRDAGGQPLVSPEITLDAPVARRKDRSDVNVTLRGVGARYFTIRPELRLIEGRMLNPGTQELLVGESAHRQFLGLDVGNKLRLQGGDWTVVGIFAGGNGSRQSEVIADVRTMMSAYKMATVNTVTVLLDSPGSVPTFENALKAQPRLGLRVLSEPKYLATAENTTNRMLRLVAYSVGSIMAVGAFFAALNAIHSSMTSRRVEIATLRAIGFDARAVVTSILIEALLLALLGAAIGIAIDYAAFNGAVISTLGGAQFDSQLVYALTITPSLVAAAVVSACALGVLGGLFPAIGAARCKVAYALQET